MYCEKSIVYITYTYWNMFSNVVLVFDLPMTIIYFMIDQQQIVGAVPVSAIQPLDSFPDKKKMIRFD